MNTIKIFEIDINYYIKIFRNNQISQMDINFVEHMLPIYILLFPKKGRILKKLLEKRFIDK